MDNRMQAQSFQDEFDAILASDMPDIDKLAWAFGRITDDIIDYARQEIEWRTRCTIRMPESACRSSEIR